MFIAGVGTAVPPYRYSQAECLAAFRASAAFAALAPASRTLLARILGNAHGVSHRHLALADLADAFDIAPDPLQRRFLETAPALGAQAAFRALEKAGIDPQSIDALLISTCTGYLCPGLTSYCIERMGLRPDVLALDLVGQGCAAAIPNLRAAEALLASGRARQVLSICVEVCSAALYLDDDPGVLVSACLFADGAGAVVLSANPTPVNDSTLMLEWTDSDALTVPAQRDLLRFEQRGGLLRNILSPAVPELAASHAGSVLDQVLARHDLTAMDINGWVWHGGGKTVIDALQSRLGLQDEGVRLSRHVLAGYGNLSSAFVFFVLEAGLAEAPPPGWWWMSSFGAGFSCHGALLRLSPFPPSGPR